VLVNDGGNTDVYIYNCSLKQVGELPSTGTGVQNSAGGADLDGGKLWFLMLAALGTIGLALFMRHRLDRAALRIGEVGEDAPVSAHGEETVS
jgi:hypothetical protein